MENFASQIVINDKYKYDLQSLYKDDGDLQSFANINPLEEKEIILFSEIPNEAIHKKEKIVFKFGYNTDQDNNMYYSLESREHIVTYDLDKQ